MIAAMLSKFTAGFTSQIVRFDLINGIVQKWIWCVSISCLVFVWFSAWGVLDRIAWRSRRPHFLGVTRSRMGVTSTESECWHCILVYCSVSYSVLSVRIVDTALVYANELNDTITTELSNLFMYQNDIWLDLETTFLGGHCARTSL